MKKIVVLLSMSCLLITGSQTLAQGGPPNPGDKPLFSTPPLGSGGSAPVGSGSLLLLGLGATYALKKLNNIHNDREIEE